MARITSLKIEGLRGRSFNLTDFPNLLLATGDHGAGKSTVADAIRFLALGYVPEIGRDSAALERLMDGRRIAVSATLDDGRAISRSVDRHRGGLRSSASASWVAPKATMTEHSEAITGLWGADRREVEENLDLRALLSASPNERARRIEELLDASGMDADATEAYLEAYTYGRLAGADAEDIAVAQPRSPGEVGGAYAATIDDALAAEAGRQIRASADTVRKEGLGTAIEGAALFRATVDRQLKQRRAARAELEDRIAGTQPPKGTLDALRARRTEIAEKRGEALAEAAAARRDAGKRADALRAGQRLEGLRAAEARLRQQIERCAAQRAQIEVPTLEPLTLPALDLDADPCVIDAARAAKEAAAQVGERPAQPVEPDRTEAGLAQSRVDEAKRLVESLVDWAEVRRIGEGLVKASIAPQDGKRLVELADEVGVHDAIEGLSRAERDLTEQAGALRERLREHGEAMKAWRRDVEMFEERAERARTAQEAHAAAIKEARMAHETRNERARVEYAAKVAARDAAQRALNAVNANAEAARKDLDDARLQIAEIEATLKAIPPERDVADTDAAVTRLDEEAAGIARTIEELEDHDARLREMHSITADIARAEHESEAVRAVEWALQRIRELDLAQRGQGIIDRMGAFLRAAGRPEEPYLRAEKRQVDFGWVRGSKTIHISAASRGENVLLSTALASAIVSMRAPELRVLLIEGAEAGLWTKNLMNAIAQVPDLSNAVLSTWVGAPADRDGWQVLQFGLKGDA